MREGWNGAEFSQRILALTIATYRVTERCSAYEPLCGKIRAKALEALEAAFGDEDFSSGVRVMLGYFEVAKSLPEINPINFTVLSREYREFASQRESEKKKTFPYAYLRQRVRPRSDRQEKNDGQAGVGAAGEPMGAGKSEHGHGDAWQPDAFNGPNDRQKIILAHLKRNSKVRISDLYGMFAGASAKTIQRDLHDLVERNAVKKEGERRWTIYTLA